MNYDSQFAIFWGWPSTNKDCAKLCSKGCVSCLVSLRETISAASLELLDDGGNDHARRGAGDAGLAVRLAFY